MKFPGKAKCTKIEIKQKSVMRKDCLFFALIGGVDELSKVK
jgi:hypothetical protein